MGMNTTKTVGEWGAELKRLNKAIIYLDEEYKTIQGVENKETILTALKCVERRANFIADTLVTIEVSEL